MKRIIQGILKLLPDEQYIKMKYRYRMKQKLNLEKPEKFSEKLQWLKLYDRKDKYTNMVDKYEVKRYVSSIIGEQYVIPTLGIYNTFDEINFEELPQQFVIKCTHDSGGVVICKDKNKIDIQKIKRKINKSLKTNYYYAGREWPYKNVKPRIIIEKFMCDDNQKELVDYKFHCFNGEPKILLVCTDRSSKVKYTYFDIDFNLLELREEGYDNDKKLKKPLNFEKMKEFASILSMGIPSVRVDFYDIDGNLYFGELTFFSGSGFEVFKPSEWDKKLGDMLVLPKEKVEEENEK